MKKLILLCAVVLGFALNASAQTESKADIKFVSEKFDFGKIAQGKPVTTNFEFSNVGTEPLILTNVQPTCGCTIADYTKTPVAPGAKGNVKVTFNAAVVGQFTKTIVVSSNAKTPTKYLNFVGEVLAPAGTSSSVGTK